MKSANGHHQIAVAPLKYEKILQNECPLEASYLLHLCRDLQKSAQTSTVKLNRRGNEKNAFAGKRREAPKLR